MIQQRRNRRRPTCKTDASRKGGHLPRSSSSRAPGVKRRRSRSAGSASRVASTRDPAKLATLPDEALLESVQRQTFRYFWEAAHPDSGLAFDRRTSGRRLDEAVDETDRES